MAHLVLALLAFLIAAPALAVENPTMGEQTVLTKPTAYKRGFTAKPGKLKPAYDGDSFAYNSPTVNYRIVGLDAPEMAIKCEHDRAIAARDELRRLMAPGNKVLIRVAKARDKYGRNLAQVFSNGTDVATILVGKGLAHSYNGGTRPPWPDC